MKHTNQHKMLSLAIKLAAKFHHNVFDKGGNPYILHPLQVMANLGDDTTDPELRQIAILHDVIEDCIKEILEEHYRETNPDNWEKIVSEIIAEYNQEEKVNIALSILTEWGFSTRVTDGLKLMTKLSTDIGEDGYFAYIKRMFDNIDAIRVKIADIRHNTDILRLKGITEKDFARNRKYAIAFHMLTERLSQLCNVGCR